MDITLEPESACIHPIPEAKLGHKTQQTTNKLQNVSQISSPSQEQNISLFSK